MTDAGKISVAIAAGRAVPIRTSPPSAHRPRRRRAWRGGCRHCRGSARCRDRGAGATTARGGAAAPVPMRAPVGKSARRAPLCDTIASRGSSRGNTQAISSPSGRKVSMSFSECTARSMRRSIRAASISLENRPLPPISASGAILHAVSGGADRHHLDRAGQVRDAPPATARAPDWPGTAPSRCRGCRCGGARNSPALF